MYSCAHTQSGLQLRNLVKCLHISVMNKTVI